MDKILRASYGDDGQRGENRKSSDLALAAKIRKDFNERKKSDLRQEVTPPPEKKGYRPPFWDSKKYGEPYGCFHRGPKQRKPLSGFIEINQGIRQPLAPGQGKKAASSPLKPYEIHNPHKDSQFDRKMTELEEKMRQRVKHVVKVHVRTKNVLLEAFGKVLSKRHVEITIHDSVDVHRFMSAWATLGIQVSEEEAVYLFNKYGQNAEGKMPVLMYSDAIVAGQSRLVMRADKVVKGAPTGSVDSVHTGKIVYPQCKNGVFAPSNFDPELLKRSAELPDVGLELEFVYGYDGLKNTANNIFCTKKGDTVYHTAAVGIVYNRDKHTQRFFQNHTDDILCTSISHDGTKIATGQCGKDPCAIIWDPDSMQEIQRLYHGYGFRGVQAVHFSSTGSKLATITTDNSHSLFIWDWKRKEILLQRKTQPGAPPCVYGVMWSKFEPARLVTYGQNHIKFWSLLGGKKGNNSQLLAVQVDAGQYGKYSPHTIFSACFLPSGQVLTGNADGRIFVWKQCHCVGSVDAHKKGPLHRRPDGTESYGGVRCIVMHANGKEVISGGSDGCLIRWEVAGGDLGAQLQKIPIFDSDEMQRRPPPQIRGLCIHKNSDSVIVGTTSCDILLVEFSGQHETLIFGHQADVDGLAMNPAKSHLFATVCDSGKVAIWNSATHKVEKVLTMGAIAKCGCFSPDGKYLAVGMRNGGFKVVELATPPRQIVWRKTFNSAISDMKYSPSGKHLAVASHDQFIDVFDVRKGYQKTSRCTGHSSTIRHIDWSSGGDAIQSNDHAYEVLHFNPVNGRRLKSNQRDTQWDTWTCVLGFPVMGIWPKDSDGTDVNSVDRSPSGRYLVTADDYGKVKLFNYPCIKRFAPALSYPGHCSHVTKVRWSENEKIVVSVGGNDRSVLQWAAVKKSKPAVKDEVVMRQMRKDGIEYVLE